MDPADIWNRFHTVDAATAESTQAVTATRACYDAAIKLDAVLPDSREKSLAMTHLQQAAMWTAAGLAREASERANAPADQPANAGAAESPAAEAQGAPAHAAADEHAAAATEATLATGDAPPAAASS